MAKVIENVVRTIKGVKVAITPKAIIKVQANAIIGMLFNLKGAKIVTLHTLTDARLRKTSKVDKTIKNPYFNVKKLSVVNGLFNVSYENCVNNQLGRENKENDFESAPRQWGQKVNDSKVLLQHVNKDGEYNQYFQFNPRQHISTVYVDENGNVLDKSLIEDFISDKKPSSRQGTNKEIIWRTYKVGSILGVSVNKTFYEVI